MALQYTVNQSPATGAIAMFTLRTAFVAAGGTILKDSDGTTYSSSGTQVTSGASGTHGLGNSYAWFVVQLGTRQFCIQRSNIDNTQWRITYSPAAGFVSGSPAAHVCPSATDQSTNPILGGGTEASPTFASLFGTDNGYRYEIAVDAASPHGFWAIAFPKGSSAVNNCSSGFFMDPMLTSSVLPSDSDPVVVGAMQANAMGSSFSNFTGLVNGGWQNITPIVYQFTPNGGFITDPTTGKDRLFPVFYYTQSVLDKGTSTLFQWQSVQGRITPTPGQSVTANDQMTLGYLVVAWNGSTITV